MPKKFLSFTIPFLLALSLFAVHKGGTGVWITIYLYVDACKLRYKQSYKEKKKVSSNARFNIHYDTTCSTEDSEIIQIHAYHMKNHSY